MSVIDIKMITESLIFNKSDIEYKVDDFKNGKSKKLLITGLSGSGKSTLATKYAKEYNAIYIELDLFEHNHFIFDRPKENSLSDGEKIIKKYFIDKYGGGKDFSEVSDEEFSREFAPFLTFILNDNRKMVVEGLQFVTQNKSVNTILQSKDYPMIIKGTSVATSMIRRYKRDREENIYKFLLWYIKMDRDLTKNIRSKYR